MTETIDRAALILGGLDLPRLRGIEIGPLSKPLVRKSEGPVIYVDQASTEALRARYADQPHYDPAAIQEVDTVWAHGRLATALGEGVRADYIVASHVIEHVPDLVRWLQALAEVLAPGGQIRLAIPDKRFIFDRPRQPSVLADVLAAWLQQDTRPPPRAILDEMLNIATVDWVAAWRGTLDDSTLQRFHTRPAAIAATREAIMSGAYRDTHCWVFTPTSFAGLMADLGELGLLPLACDRLVDTPHDHYEFYATLVPSHDAGAVARSWRAAVPVPPPTVDPDVSALARARAELALLRASTSWRITAPLRALARKLGRA
jgi:SAM-dependent methyltransferase